MAYRRFRPNRRFRNTRRSRAGRFGSGRRRTYGFRRSFRSGRYRRGGLRRGGMRSSRVRRIAATKKSDHSVGSFENTVPVVSNSVLTGPGMVYCLYSPTYMPRQLVPKDIPRRDHLREQSNIFFRAVKEEVFLSVSEPCFWRRIVFYYANEITEAAPLYGAHPATGNPFRIRNMATIDPSAGGEQANLGQELWAGMVGVDYTEDTRWKAPLDKDNLTVAYDRTATINPNRDYAAEETYGKNRIWKMWHPVNKSLEYDDKETGQDVNPSPWVSDKPRQGNMYIMDIFSTGRVSELDVSFGTWNVDSTIYWHET